MTEEITHAGGCHCGRVRFEVRAPAELEVYECNCSRCRQLGYLHLIVPSRRFQLVRGEEDLAEYRFGSNTARHLFCRHCGVQSFYVPRSNPDGYSVNARCLGESTVDSMKILPFDGRNWERHAAALGHLSE